MAVQSAFAGFCAGFAAWTRRRARRALMLLVLCAGVFARARAAHANGAFPDSLQILLPADRPHQIVLSTNFGLIISDDDGATWTWTCEQKEIISGGLYAVGPSPADRFFGLSPSGLAFSDDDSCTWQVSGGALTTLLAKDFFPDPTDPSHVLAIAATPVATGASYSLVESRDRGATFGAALYTAPAGGFLIGVENARADPRTIYLALYTTTTTAPNTPHPALVRSTDGGATWTTTDLEPALGPNKFLIIGVDPVDPATIYLRVQGQTSEAVVLSRDGGATFQTAASVDNGVISAFARLASGTVLVGAIAGADALGFRSTDGGATFAPWAPVPHLRALAERGGKLYAAAKNYTDLWAIGVSTDEGVTFTPLTSYARVQSVRACVKAACADSCDFQAGSGIWPPAVCFGGNFDGGADAGASTRKAGCGCAVAGGSWRAALAAALAAAALAVARARRR